MKNNHNETRPAISELIKREVRQRCGFGCVICGIPLYEYEHMEEWAVVRRHVAEEITLLCDRHHREKTAGWITKEFIVEENKKPYNLREGISKPYDLYFSGGKAEILIGSTTFSTQNLDENNTLVALAIDGLHLLSFSFQNNHLLLNATCFNQTNECILKITNNQLIYSTSPWDIELIGKTLTIREAKKEILYEMIFSPPHKISIKRGRILCNGVEILVRPTHFFIPNSLNMIVGGTFIGNAGMAAGTNIESINAAIAFTNLPRYNLDRVAALQYERKALKKITKLKRTDDTPKQYT